MIVYISGPMRGVVNGNAELFAECERHLRDLGHKPVNPHKLDELDEKKVMGDTDYARRDLNMIIDSCDAICMLPGWQDSVGAVAEWATARWTGKHLLRFEDGFTTALENQVIKLKGPTVSNDPSMPPPTHLFPDTPQIDKTHTYLPVDNAGRPVWSEAKEGTKVDPVAENLVGGVICDSLKGERGEDQQRIADTGVKWLQLLLKKNSDYGGSAWKSPILSPTMDPGTAMLCRMSDKVERIGRLRSGGYTAHVDETLEDTVRDLGAYCLLWLSRPEE